MKISMLTFHWAENQGAIVQAFAMHTYLKKPISSKRKIKLVIRILKDKSRAEMWLYFPA